jgi:hypothetical protein
MWFCGNDRAMEAGSLYALLLLHSFLITTRETYEEKLEMDSYCTDLKRREIKLEAKAL